MEPFKNVFSPALVMCLADHLERNVDGFERERFQRPILAELGTLELKARSQLIADQVHLALPSNSGRRDEVLRGMLRPVVDGEAEHVSDDLGIGGWGVMPLSMVVGQHGIEDFERSLALLREMTTRFSSEFAVRYFLLADQTRALVIMQQWIDDPSLHVRRLVTEGTRPRLPWAMQLPLLVADPSPVLPILTALRDDPEEYVRRSVANHLNDIAKDHADLVGAIASEWMRDADTNRMRLVRHACRTLVKEGHPGALAAFGLKPPEVEVQPLGILTPQVAFGGSLEFSATIRSTADEPQDLVVDYVLHLRKANGRLAPKVFKWKRFTLGPREVRTDDRSHAIRPITTRRYYPGEQRLSLRINGQDFPSESFDLAIP